MGLENRKLMQKIAAIVTAAAIILPSAAVYAEPDSLDTITSSGAADVGETPAEDNEAIGDDNANNNGNTDTSENGSSDNLIDTAVGSDAADDEQNNTAYDDAVSGDTAAAAEATAEPTAAPETKQTRLVNGDFEYPQIYSRYFQKNIVNNVDSECGPWFVVTRERLKEIINAKDGIDIDLDKVGWYTTAYDKKIEFAVGKNDKGDGLMNGVAGSWGAGTSYDNYKVPFKEISGRQYAELCAEDQASLYQVISTKEGTVLDWKLKHRASRDTGKDTMALFIGDASCISKDGSYQAKLTKPADNAGDGKSDIFMWMAELLKAKGIVNITYNSGNKAYTTSEEVGTNREFTVYSVDNIGDVSLSSIKYTNYEQYFSLTPTEKINKEWKCWIITDDNTKWGNPSGTYSVAEGQENSIFAFTALSGKVNNGNSKSINQGNLLDDVEFSASYPLKVSSTGGGSGTVTITDNDYNVSDDVNYQKTHDGIYMEDTNVKITATANTNEGESEYKFLGANIGGKFYSASDTSKFAEEDGIYTLSFELNEPTYVHLIFSKSSTVIYDPNGGKYNGSDKNTEYKLGSSGYPEHKNADINDRGNAIPNNTENTRFRGWYFVGVGNSGGIITSDHIITYVSKGGDLENDVLRVQYKTSDQDTEYSIKDIPADDGITFVAQYDYLQKAVVMVKDTTDYEYKEDMAGNSQCKVQVGNNSGVTAEEYQNLAATVSTKATRDPSGNYIFMGWYDAPNGGNKISEKALYTYSVDGPRVVYARFSKSVQFPYLSFVAADNKEALQLKEGPFNIGSHIKVGETVVSTYDNENITDGVDDKSKSDISNNHIGSNVYGNTISTGFVANMNQLDKDTTVNNCVWTIEIPVKDTYVKSTYSDDMKFNKGESIMSFEKNPILKDPTGISYNSGNIYKVNEIDGSKEGKVTLKFRDKLPATVTGDIVVTYGLVIDNLYAPGAQATMSFEQDDSAIDISTEMHSGKFEDYVSNVNNPYNTN